MTAETGPERPAAAPLRALAVGFDIVTLGAIVAGVVDLLTGLGPLYGVLVRSALTTEGFAVITYSPYAE